MVKERGAFCRVLLPDSDGVVHGELDWDSVYDYLVAITPNGAFAINLDGEVLGSHPDCKYTEDNPLQPKGKATTSVGITARKAICYTIGRKKTARLKNGGLTAQGISAAYPAILPVGWVHHCTITREPLVDRVFLSSPRRILCRSAYAEIRLVRPPVYSCKKSVKNQYFRGDLQANKEARRNRRAYLHQLVSVLMAFPAGFEPTACRLGGDRSILLSYGNI